MRAIFGEILTESVLTIIAHVPPCPDRTTAQPQDPSGAHGLQFGHQARRQVLTDEQEAQSIMDQHGPAWLTWCHGPIW